MIKKKKKKERVAQKALAKRRRRRGRGWDEDGKKEEEEGEKRLDGYFLRHRSSQCSPPPRPPQLPGKINVALTVWKSDPRHNFLTDKRSPTNFSLCRSKFSPLLTFKPSSWSMCLKGNEVENEFCLKDFEGGNNLNVEQKQEKEQGWGEKNYVEG